MEKSSIAEILALAILCSIGLAISMATGVLAYYPGDSVTFSNDMQIDNLVYTIVGNTTEVYPEVIINSTNITINFPSDMPPNNFKIVFIKNNTNEIIKVVNSGSSSSGGTRIVYINKNVTKTEYINISVPGETIYLDKETTFDKINKIKKLPFDIKDYKKLIIPGLIILFIIIIIVLISLYLNREKDYNTENEGVVYNG